MKTYKITEYASGWTNGSGWSYEMDELGSEILTDRQYDAIKDGEEPDWYELAGFRRMDYEDVARRIDGNTDVQYTVITEDITDPENPAIAAKFERWESDIAQDYIKRYKD